MCIHAEKGPGIVYATDSAVKCATCKKSSCQHIITEPDRPSFLDVFVSALENLGNRLPKKEALGTALSWKPISFDNSANISCAFTQSLAERFQIKEGMCYLRDTHTTITCESCGELMIEKEYPSIVVTRNQILQAKGIPSCIHDYVKAKYSIISSFLSGVS